MAEYKGIQGYSVEYLEADPPAAKAVGRLWYNDSGSGAFKIGTSASGSWSSGGALNTGRGQFGLTGIVTAAVAFGGSPSQKNNTEQYDGTTWTAKNTLNTGTQYNVGFGTSTAATNTGGVVSGGADTGVTESWDGTNWTTSPGTLNTARQKMSASNQAPSTTGIIFGGYKQSPNTSVNNTEEWNGSAWSEKSGDLNTAREAGGGGGTATAAFIAGGNIYSPSSLQNLTELWNGTSWTASNPLNTSRQGTGSSGTTTSALVYGGTTGSPTAVTEQWDGTSWTEVGDLATAAEGKGKGCGVSGDSALAAGFDGSPNTITEEWTSPIYTIKTVTVS